jgi:acetoin utilization deacetylase AcuC-like enzyme
MVVITTDYAGHDPEQYTLPGGIRSGTGDAVRAAGLPTRPAPDRGLEPIASVHDADYLTFLRTAFERWQGGPILPAPAHAIARGAGFGVRRG